MYETVAESEPIMLFVTSRRGWKTGCVASRRGSEELENRSVLLQAESRWVGGRSCWPRRRRRKEMLGRLRVRITRSDVVFRVSEDGGVFAVIRKMFFSSRVGSTRTAQTCPLVATP